MGFFLILRFVLHGFFLSGLSLFATEPATFCRGAKKRADNACGRVGTKKAG